MTIQAIHPPNSQSNCRYEVAEFQRRVRQNYKQLKDETWVEVCADGTLEEVEVKLLEIVNKELAKERAGVSELWQVPKYIFSHWSEGVCYCTMQRPKCTCRSSRIRRRSEKSEPRPISTRWSFLLQFETKIDILRFSATVSSNLMQSVHSKWQWYCLPYQDLHSKHWHHQTFTTIYL